jgi:catechol-2,3-dioxygenase
MLKNSQILPTLPATDLNRAKNFYESKLGLKTVETNKKQIMLNAGNGNMISMI